MGVEFASERRLLTEDELGPVQNSHYPALDAMSHEDLVGLARWLRSQHGRARDLVRGRRRASRGKAEPRGTMNEPANQHGLQAKKQVFARGLKRVNARLAKLSAKSKQARAAAGMREALARRQSAPVHHPQPGATADSGMEPITSSRRRGIITGDRIGSTSQAVRHNQAARDNRA